MKNTKTLYHGHRLPTATIRCAVHCYLRFQLSLRDIEELLFGVVVIDETIRRWCDKFGAGFGIASKPLGVSPARRGTSTTCL